MKKNAPEYLVNLRQATHTIHKSVELMTDIERLLGDAPELSQYQQFLSSHFLLHSQVAEHSKPFHLQANMPSLLDWPNCPRIEALQADLDQLHLDIKAINFPSIPNQSHGFALGLIYTCEGSCIGNQRVLAALTPTPSFQQWNSKHFLSTCKVGFSERWKKLLSAMQELCTHQSPVDGSGYKELEAGAIAGFNLYKDYWNALEQTPA